MAQGEVGKYHVCVKGRDVFCKSVAVGEHIKVR